MRTSCALLPPLFGVADAADVMSKDAVVLNVHGTGENGQSMLEVCVFAGGYGSPAVVCFGCLLVCCFTARAGTTPLRCTLELYAPLTPLHHKSHAPLVDLLPITCVSGVCFCHSTT